LDILKPYAMKNLFSIFIFSSVTLLMHSCMSISEVIDDDVYVMKGPSLPITESLDDETSYSTYRYKKDRGRNHVDYFDSYQYGRSPHHHGMYGMRPQWMYRPGFGWVIRYSHHPYGYDPFWGGGHYGYNPYGYGGMYGYNPYYGYGYPSDFYMYGHNPYGSSFNYYNDPYMVGGYGWNPYGNPWGNQWGNNLNNGGNFTGNNPNWGGNTTTSGNHHTGPRGSFGGGGVGTRPGNNPGILKSGQQSTNTFVKTDTKTNTVSASKGNLDKKPISTGDLTSKSNFRTVTSNSNISNSKTNNNTSFVSGEKTRNYNKPGEIGNTSNSRQSANSGSSNGVSISRGNSSGTTGNSPSRTTIGNSNSSSPSRSTGSGSISSPSNSGSGSISSPSRGGGGSSGGSSGGSVGGGRRP
jgi:hypothetical protein